MITKAFSMVLALAATASLPLVASAQARTFVVVPSGARATFTSDAPLERINGVSTGVSGEFTVDPANLAGARGAVQVRVATIRTGIDLRDEHLRSPAWLDATAHPNAKFELTGIRGGTSLTVGREARLTLAGRFTIHGRTRDVTAEARVTLLAPTGGATVPDTISVNARFNILLTEYGVSVPAIVRLKVSDTISVAIRFNARAR